jgi:hypothetical protein
MIPPTIYDFVQKNISASTLLFCCPQTHADNGNDSNDLMEDLHSRTRDVKRKSFAHVYYYFFSSPHMLTDMTSSCHDNSQTIF